MGSKLSVFCNIVKTNFSSSYQNCFNESKQESKPQDIRQVVGKAFVAVLVSRTVPVFDPRDFASKIGMLQDNKARN